MRKKIPKGNVRFSLQLSKEQKEAKTVILKHPYSFILGQAGTGKTLLAIQIALDKLFKREVHKIVITRPTVSSEKNGFLPGNIEEKMEPWLIPIFDNLSKVYNKKQTLQNLLDEQRIEVVSLAHFRGRTFDSAVCIVDEFQNLTTPQLAMCIGRLGKESLMLFSGDINQVDLTKKESCVEKLQALQQSNHVCKITLNTNYRHPALQKVLKLLYS